MLRATWRGLETWHGRDTSANWRASPRPYVRPGKASMFSRRQSCRGKSQSPVVRIAEEMETEPSKPIDKISRGEIHESPGCIKRERIVASKKVAPRAEPTSEGRRQHEQPNTDRNGCSPRRGGSDGTGTRRC